MNVHGYSRIHITSVPLFGFSGGEVFLSYSCAALLQFPWMKIEISSSKQDAIHKTDRSSGRDTPPGHRWRRYADIIRIPGELIGPIASTLASFTSPFFFFEIKG